MAEDLVSSVVRWMKQESVDAVFVKCPENIRYLLNYGGRSDKFTGVIIKPDGLLVLFIPELDLVRALETVAPERILAYKDVDDPFLRFGQNLSMYGIGKGARLGIELAHLSVLESEHIRAVLPGVEFVDTGKYFERMRAVKTSREISLIEESIRIAEFALDEALGILESGEPTEAEVAAVALQAMLERGAEKAAFDIRVLSGPRTAAPHGLPTKRLIRENDIIIIDLGAVYGGYCSDITRTFVMGKPCHYYLDMYEAVLEAEERAIESIAPGVTCSFVDRVARGVLEERGYGPKFTHRTGHGVGLRVRESPSLDPRDTTILEEGMVLAVEPGVYVPGLGGVRIEDMVLVTGDGFRVLSGYRRDPYTWQLGGVSFGKKDPLD